MAKTRRTITPDFKAEAVKVVIEPGRSPWFDAELVGRGLPCCANTVARLMRQQGIVATIKQTIPGTRNSNHDHPVAEIIVNRQVEPTVDGPADRQPAGRRRLGESPTVLLYLSVFVA